MKRSALAFVSSLAILIVAVTAIATIPGIQTGTWQPMGSTDARSGTAAVLLQDRRVLITGGKDPNGALDSAEVFNLDGSFAAAAPMGMARAQHIAIVLKDGSVAPLFFYSRNY